MRSLGRLVVFAAGLSAVALATGFVIFARNAAETTPPVDPHAQGIVVLTGESARINSGLELLAEGRASRLLISGVNPAVTAKTLAETFGATFGTLLACCVDLGHAARNTMGNAAETRAWVAREHFTSLLVVTSDYHMQRSMAELADAMPGIKLLPVPIANPAQPLADWWKTPTTFALLAREYGKYVLAVTRLAVGHWLAAAGGLAPDATAASR